MSKVCFICKRKINEKKRYESICIRPVRSYRQRKTDDEDLWSGIRFEFYVCKDCFRHLEGSRFKGSIPMFSGVDD